MSNINPSALAEMNEAQQEAEALSQKAKLTVQEEKRFNYLLSKISAIKQGFVPQEERLKKIDAAVRQLEMPRTAEQRQRELPEAEKAFRNFLRDGDKTAPAYRTYVAENTTAAGVFIPALWAAEYGSRLQSFSGIREAGATIVTTETAQPYTRPFIDDAGHTGERLNESDPSTLLNPIASKSTLGGFRYGSKGVIVSNELVSDSLYDLNGFLQNIFAKRIGKITNTEFTNGASGGPAGVIPSLTVGVTSASPTAVTLAELLALPKSLDYAYRTPDAAPVWMFSDGVEAILKGMLASTSGVRLFPEMDGGELLGYKFCVNVDMPQSLTATGKTIAFGSFKNGVTIRQSTPIVAVSKERYAEFFQTYFALVLRQDCVVSDANAIAVLQMHA